MRTVSGHRIHRLSNNLQHHSTKPSCVCLPTTRGHSLGRFIISRLLPLGQKKSPNRTVRGYHWLAQVKEYGSGSDRSGAPRYFASHETGTLCSIISKSPISPSHIMQVFFDQLITSADDPRVQRSRFGRNVTISGTSISTRIHTI